MKATIKDLKKGDFFTLRDYGDEPAETRVFVRGDYDRSAKRFECYRFDDVTNIHWYKGSREVFAGFTF